MRKIVKRSLAMLLSLAMVLTILPMAAFADASAGGSSSAAPNGATDDVWKLDEATRQPSGDAPICEKTAEGLHLKAGTAGGNGHGSDTAGWPAMFVNETASAALFGESSGEKFVEITFKSALAAENTRFGVYLNYTDPSKGFFVGYDADGWFWEEYGGTGGTWYQGNRVQGPAANTATTLRLEWNGTNLTKATVKAADAESATDLFPDMPHEFGTTSDVTGTKLGIKCSPWGSDITEVTILDMKYTGQKAAETVLPDGAVADEWVQIEASKVSGSVAPTVENGKIVLSAAASNGNNINGDNPAIFVDTDMNKALSALEDSAERTLSFTLTPSATGDWMGFALLLRYDGTTGSNIHTYQIGYPSGETTGWFTENFGASNYGYPGFTGPDMTAGAPVDFEITWTETEGISSFKIGGQSVSPSSDYPLTSVPAIGDNPDGFKGVGFKVATKNGSVTTLRLSNVHYTGQKEEVVPPTPTTFKVSGVVKCDSAPIEGAVVTLGGTETAITDASGAYSFSGVENGTYAIAVSANGYENASGSVEVNGADVTKNFALTRKTVYELFPDGALVDDWAQDSQTVRGTGSICEVTDDGHLHLKAGSSNANNGDSWPGTGPAVFVSDAMADALKAENGVYKVTFKVKPLVDGICFGVYVNYKNPNGGMLMGYNTPGGWFWQKYGGGGSYENSNGPSLSAGTVYDVELTWNPTAKTYTYKMGEAGKTLTAVVTNQSYAEVANAEGIGVINNIGIKLGKSNTGVIGEVEIWDLHYSGQPTVTAYPVGGTVKDGSGVAIAGATVSAGANYTATTDASGAYSLILPVGGYTITASKDGYEVGSATVTVTDSAIGNVDITLNKLPVVSGVVTDGTVPVPDVTVTLTQGEGDTTVVKTGTTDAQGRYTIIGVPAGTYTVSVSAVGYKLPENTETELEVSADVTKNITLEESFEGILVLENSAMTVLVDEDFPRVIQYRLKGEDGLRMDGQKQEISTILINGTPATIESITSVLSEDKGTVTYTIVMSAPVAATMTARLTLNNEVNKADSASKDRTLGFYIDEVVYTNDDRLTNPVKNIEIPNHSLVSVNSTQPGAEFTGGAANGNTSVKTNDVTYTAAANKTMNWTGAYFAAFVSNNQLSAGITSNSSLNGGTAATSNAVNRITMVSDGENVTFGLSSVAWPYDYLLADSNPTINGAKQDHTTALTAEQKVIDPALREQPFVKVVIAPELNGDGQVNWQDGAIALRETVMHIPNNSQSIKDRVNTRIALNFGSQAQNPFLTSLDNAKRVALHTDGLGQAILLKGYANEGHDSGHPDYWDIGTRMGGPTDFATMLNEGKEIGAYFGIHVNAGELYAEAKALDDDIIFYRDPANNLVKWGWHWHDTAISFKTLHDFGTGDRQNRFQTLFENGGAGLEFIYVDIWGNCTGGTDDSWQTRMLANEITRWVGDGHWRIAHEWAWANPYDSTFQHWTTDFTYGNYSDKGALNSAVIRFLLNEYKDSFPADFASYGGACNAPLLGGPAMQGFEGWQGDGEYDLSIYNTYNQMIPTKFLQHYGITNWTNADNAVAIPYNGGGAGGSRGSTTADWTPEMQIKLANGADKVVVTRGLDTTLDTTASFSVANEVEYRSRVMTLNDKVILTGAPASAGEDSTFPHSAATLKYLIPWYWTTDGQRVSADQEKLYHWNAQGGSSTWELPNGWEELSTVTVYELSDQGRINGTTISVNNGSVTLTAKAETGYVVVKGENGAKAPDVTYYADGQHITDPSFNDASFLAWEVTGSVEKVNSIHGISVMKQTGDASVSQTLVGMTPGAKYLAYVAVENKSDAPAYIEIKDAEGNVLARNYTIRSIANNYISGDALNNNHGVEIGGSKIQNMYVFFVMPDSGYVTLTLGHEGDGYVYFDALRILETQMDGYTYDADGNVNGLKQDFEHSAQGEWPFVVGPIDGVQDNMQHLSEKHAPYTQSGWNIREVDDVIDGNWSLKVHGERGNGQLVYQTIPQNFRFEPGKTYTVTFQYEMGCENLMQVVIGDGAWNGVGNCQTIPLEMAKGAGIEGGSGPKTCTFTIVGSESGQTWFGIATAGGSFNSAGLADQDGYGLYFSGRGDFILDNLKIKERNVDLAPLNAAVNAASDMNRDDYVVAGGYEGTEDEAWAAFTEALDAAQMVLSDIDAEQSAIDAALATLNEAVANLKKVQVTVSGTVTDEKGNLIANAVITLEDSSYMPVGLTAVTDENGAFRFESTEDVELKVQNYKLKVQADGYDVTTVDITALTKAEADSVTGVTLTAQVGGTVVDFNDGNVSALKPLTGNVGGGSNEVIAAENGAAKLTFNSSDRNSVILDGVQMENGTFEMDVTTTRAGVRVGVTVRATNMNNRIYIGHFDNTNGWGLNYWNNSDEDWSNNVLAGPGLNPGVTRRVKVEIKDSSITLWVDGVLIGTESDYDMYDGNVDLTGGAGYIGINVGRNPGNGVIIDNIRVVANQTHEHVEEIIPAVPATCTETGLTEGKKCALCGRIIEEQEIIDALGHILIHVEAVEPTTEAEGNIEYWYCERCEKYFSDEAAEVEIAKADTVLGKLPGPDVPPVLPIVPEIVIPGTEEIEDPDAPLAELPFIDVDHEKWYAQSIANVVAKGLMEGVEALLFAPEDAMTRGMMAKALYALAQKPEITDPASFLDLADGVNYADAVAWGAETGVIKGYSETEFGGEDALNRQQLATLLYRYAQLIDEQDVKADTGVLEQFSDHARVSAWAKDAMAWAVANELVIGRTDGTLDPRATITRAEAAAILDRYSKLFLA